MCLCVFVCVYLSTTKNERCVIFVFQGKQKFSFNVSDPHSNETVERKVFKKWEIFFVCFVILKWKETMFVLLIFNKTQFAKFMENTSKKILKKYWNNKIQKIN